MKRSPLKRRTPLRARRLKPRRDGQWRSREHLDRVKELGYCSAAALLGVTGCWSIIDPDHMGKRPGIGIKCGDDRCAPMCRRCHTWRTDRSGAFKGWSDEQMDEFCNAAIDAAQQALDWQAVGADIHAVIEGRTV